MKILTKKYAQVLYEITEEQSKESLHRMIAKFAAYIRKQNLVSKLPQIISDYKKYYQKMRGEQNVLLKTARPLSARNIEAIKLELEKLFRKQLIISNEIDPALCGGILVRGDDLLIDLSLKNQMVRLKETMTK